jgi:hypothetical protein
MIESIHTLDPCGLSENYVRTLSIKRRSRRNDFQEVEKAHPRGYRSQEGVNNT